MSIGRLPRRHGGRFGGFRIRERSARLRKRHAGLVGLGFLCGIGSFAAFKTGRDWFLILLTQKDAIGAARNSPERRIATDERTPHPFAVRDQHRAAFWAPHVTHRADFSLFYLPFRVHWLVFQKRWRNGRKVRLVRPGGDNAIPSRFR